MSSEQFHQLLEILSNDTIEWWGIGINALAIIVSIGVAVWATKQAYKDNLKQNLFDKKMLLYSELVLPLEYLLENHTAINLIEQHREIDEKITQLYFVCSKDIYDLSVEFLKELENTINQLRIEDLEEDNKKLILLSKSLSDSMKWEKENLKDITLSEIIKIKEKYNLND